jgi:hypothetical protein
MPNKAIEVCDKLNAAWEASQELGRVIGIDIERDCKRVQFKGLRDLEQVPGVAMTRERGSVTIEAAKELQGITFFCLITRDEAMRLRESA